MLVINIDGEDVVDAVVNKRPFEEHFEIPRGQAHHLQTNIGVFDTSRLESSSIRIGLAGTDLWRPEHLLIAGQIFNTDDDSVRLIPLACEIDIGEALSADLAEGRLSIPMRPVLANAAPIERLVIVTDTADDEYSETDSQVQFQLQVGGQLVAQTLLPDSVQPDQERGTTNIYVVPVLQPFQTPSDASGFVARLTILGPDMWFGSGFYVFGLSGSFGKPATCVPLVAFPGYDPLNATPVNRFRLSSDSSEGLDHIDFPYAWNSYWG